MPQFIVLPASDVTSGNITTLANATVEPDAIVTAGGGSYTAFATAGQSAPVTPTGGIFAPGPEVISGGSSVQFLVVPDANFDAGNALTSLANSFVSTSQSLTGLVSGRAYRIVVLTIPSAAIPVAAAPSAFTAAMWTVTNPSTGGILNFNFTSLPYDGGSPITNINIYQNGSSTPIATGLTAPGPYVISGLTNGNSYSYTVKAVNAIGVASASSDTKTATPLASPVIIGAVDAFGPVDLINKMKAATGGETFVAKPGAYGYLAVTSINPASNVTVICDPGAQFESIRIKSSRNLTFDGPKVWPITFIPSLTVGLIASDTASPGIIIKNADVRGKVDAADYYNWSLAKWSLNPAFGITLSGINSSVEDCLVTATDIAIGIGGTGSQMVRNKVRGVSQDGLHIVGNGSGWIVRNNDVADFVTITSGSNHGDAFQAWSRIPGQAAGTGLLTNLIVEDNIFRRWIGPTPIVPQPGMQGIGWHNGAFQYVQMRRNIVWNATPNGANLYNVNDLILEDNQFYDINRTSLTIATIRVQGLNCIANRNVSGTQGYPASAVTSGNTQPNYATLPPMSLV